MYNVTYTPYQKLGACYLTFALVLSTYGYGGMLNFARLFSYVLIAILIIMILQKKNTFKNIPNSLNIYFIWLFFVAIVSSTSISDAIPFGQIEQYLLVTAIFTIIKFDKFLNLYKKFAYICVGVLLIQQFYFLIFGVKFSGVFEFLPIDLNLEDNQMYFERVTSEIGRFSAFFSEPAQFAQYVMPLLTIELFSAKNRKDWCKVFFISTSIFFTESGNGIILLSVIFLAYIINYFSTGGAWKAIIMPIIFIGTFLATLLYLNSEHGKNMYNRSEELNSGIEISSGFVRVQRGYYVYDEYSTIEKIIGVNNLNKLDKRIASSKAYFTFGEKDYYANTFQKFLLNTGIIGAIMYFIIMFGLMRNNTPEGKTIILTFIVMSFFAATYLSTIMYIYIYIAYNMKLCRFNKKQQ